MMSLETEPADRGYGRFTRLSHGSVVMGMSHLFSVQVQASGGKADIASPSPHLSSSTCDLKQKEMRRDGVGGIHVVTMVRPVGPAQADTVTVTHKVLIRGGKENKMKETERQLDIKWRR